MPELPEVESVRRTMRRVLQGKRISLVEVAPDEIMLSNAPPEALEQAVLGRTVVDVGRKGKYWWIELDERPWLFGHLGMSGWIRELGTESRRLHSHGDAPLDDEQGRPRFLKLLLEAEDGSRIAFTDGRRLGRMWLGEGPEEDSQIRRLGFDAFEELPTPAELEERLRKRKAPIKSVLLDQSVFAGIGNYLADEVLYQSQISPKRLASTLSPEEVRRLRESMMSILEHAIRVDADYEQFPRDWLFHFRWGGAKGADSIGRLPIVRETIGGRTTAWVPEIQR